MVASSKQLHPNATPNEASEINAQESNCNRVQATRNQWHPSAREAYQDAGCLMVTDKREGHDVTLICGCCGHKVEAGEEAGRERAQHAPNGGGVKVPANSIRGQVRDRKNRR